MELPNEAALFYILIAVTLKKGERDPPPALPAALCGKHRSLRFDHFPGVRSLDNLVLLRRTASQFRKAKPRSILASDGDLPRCHQRHMGSGGERIGICICLV